MFIILSLIVFAFVLIWSDRNETKRRPSYKKTTYEDLLRRNEWREKRLKIISRDNYKCAYCNNTHDLQVHHKYYSIYPNGERVLPWNYPDDALITLCRNHHEKVHNRKKIKTYYRKYTDNY